MAEPSEQDKEGKIKITYPEIEPILNNLLLSPQFYEQVRNITLDIFTLFEQFALCGYNLFEISVNLHVT